MSEYMFGVSRGREPRAQVETKDRICKEEGGTGYVYADIPGTGMQGWFTGPNQGEPFNRQLANRVSARAAEWLAAAGEEEDGPDPDYGYDPDEPVAELDKPGAGRYDE